MDFIYNTHRAPLTFSESASTPFDFHRQMPDYAPTPLHQLTSLAKKLGIGELLLKDESSRLGLPSFKILGASWAIHRALSQRSAKTLIAATDGNHGRAVARMARLLGLGALIFVPDNMSDSRREAIAGEGAQVVIVDGSYDDAVERCAQRADDDHLVISDTAWEGYTEIPRRVIEGYSTIFAEIDGQTDIKPDLVFVQMGVGALASAAVLHYRRYDAQKPLMVGVEPESADCVLESIRAGHPVTVPGPHPSIMAGLNCGVVSSIAFPLLKTGLDAVTGVADERAREAMRMLAACGVVSGETGAAGLAGLIEVMAHPEIQEQLNITRESVALVISTEGATDPVSYREIIGQA